jgi:hypothetical protein
MSRLTENLRIKARLGDACAEMAAEHIEKLNDAVENLLIAIGMGWDLDGVIEVTQNAMKHGE